MVMWHYQLSKYKGRLIMTEETYTITQKEKDMLDYFMTNHSDEYNAFCSLLECSKEQLAWGLVQEMQENELIERVIKRALKR